MSSEVSLQRVLEVNKFANYEFRNNIFKIYIFIIVVYKKM